MSDENTEKPRVAPLSRNRAATILGWSPRTLVRRVEEGVIERRPDGRFDQEEVERVLALALGDDDDLKPGATVRVEDTRPPVTVALDVSEKFVQQSTRHLETMVGLLVKPVEQALGTLVDINNSLQARDKERDAHYLAHMKMMGEILLQETERKAIIIEAEGKRDALRATGAQLAPFVPQLLGQMTGIKLEGDPTLGNKIASLMRFVSLLDNADKGGLFAIEHFLDGDEKKAAFREAMAAIGIQKPEGVPDEPAPQAAQ